MKNFRIFFFVFVLVMAAASILIGANTEQRVMNKGSSHVSLSVPFAETNLVINQNFVSDLGDLMLSPQNFVFILTSTANPLSPAMEAKWQNFSNLSNTMTLNRQTAVSTWQGGHSVLKKPVQGVAVSNNFIAITQRQENKGTSNPLVLPINSLVLSQNLRSGLIFNGPIMVLKLPLISFRFAKNTGG